MVLGVYVHIPYCVKKCPYCDFNSYGSGEVFPERDYTQCLLLELDMYRDLLGGAELTSIFLGGGTPSLFSPGNIHAILEKIKNTGAPGGNLEVTIEINPETVDLNKLREFRDAGVNRLSFGVQSFSQKKLDFLGRINNPGDTRAVLEDAAKAGFENFNIDLMYGTPVETLKEWENDLKEAVSFSPAHLSAYSLMIEEGTVFDNLHKRGKLPLPDEDYVSEIITFTTSYLEDNGYSQYEISNYSKPGFECCHNLLYWQGESYLGIGAGAHSHIKTGGSGWGERRGNIKNPSLYMKSVKSGKEPVDFTEELNKNEALEDKVLMGLRLNRGIAIKSLSESFKVTPDRGLLGHLVEGGLLELENDAVRLSSKGILVSNSVIEKFLDSLV